MPMMPVCVYERRFGKIFIPQVVLGRHKIFRWTYLSDEIIKIIRRHGGNKVKEIVGLENLGEGVWFSFYHKRFARCSPNKYGRAMMTYPWEYVIKHREPYSLHGSERVTVRQVRCFKNG